MEQKKRPGSRLTGGLSLALALAAIVLTAVLGGIAAVRFVRAELTEAFVRSAMKVVVAAGAISLAALVLAVVTFCMKKQKNGPAVAGLILGLLMLLCVIGGTYAYQTVFDSVNSDESFGKLSDSDLNIMQTQPDGKIDRELTTPESTASPEDIQDRIGLEQVEGEVLNGSDLPEEAQEKMNGAKPINHCYLKDGSDQITNFLLFGIDENGSSDAIMVFSVDRAHQKIKMTSLARDSYIMIPAWGTYSKLAYPYNWGGAEWAVSAVNYNYYLNIKDYIAVDLDQLEQIVDMVGGIDIALSGAELNALSRHSMPYQDGLYHLDGSAAVAYARIRSIDSEAQRTGRQRKVLTEILNKVYRMPLTDYPQFIQSCLGMCTTSLDSQSILTIALEVAQKQYTIEQFAVIDKVDYWGGVLGKEQYFYCVYDLARASDYIYRFIYEDLYISGYTDPNGAE